MDAPLRRFDERDPARAAMLELARSLGWPRLELRPSTVKHSADWIGPGVTPWYLLAEQAQANVIEDVTRKLRIERSRR